MIRILASASAIAFAFASPALAAPIPLNDAQLASLSAGAEFMIIKQVSDQAGVAPVTDSNLVNA